MGRGRFKLKVLIFIGLLFYQITPAVNVDKLSFPEALRISLENNRDIALLREKVERSENRMESAFIFFRRNPELSGAIKNRSLSKGKSFLDYELSLSLPIEIKGQRRYRLIIAKDDLRISKIYLEKKRRDINFELKNKFTDIYTLNEKIKAVNGILTAENNILQ